MRGSGEPWKLQRFLTTRKATSSSGVSPFMLEPGSEGLEPGFSNRICKALPFKGFGLLWQQSTVGLLRSKARKHKRGWRPPCLTRALCSYYTLACLDCPESPSLEGGKQAERRGRGMGPTTCHHVPPLPISASSWINKMRREGKRPKTHYLQQSKSMQRRCQPLGSE